MDTALTIKDTDKAGRTDEHRFSLTWASTRTPLIFLLSMSAVGLQFYPAVLVMLALMVSAWRNDRYQFLVMLMMAFGGFQFYEQPTFIRTGPMVAMAVFFLLILKKTPMLKKTMWAMAFYVGVILLVAWKSVEPWSHQLPIIFSFLNFFFFAFPLMIFNGREFSFEKFWRALYPYCILIFIFFVTDYFILCGYVLLPFGVDTHFYDLDCKPLTFYFRRHRCPGVYPTILLIYPIARGWKIPKWNWIFIVGTFVAIQTFTVLTGFIFAFIIAQGSVKRYGKYILCGALFFGALYAVDRMISSPDAESSVMRVSSQVDQILGFQNIQDEEDLAEAGTGRMAQVIPKVELLNELQMQRYGFGFLHPQLTTNEMFMIYNPFYIDVSKAEEIATGVEISAVQVYLNMGYVGLTCVIIWLIWLWWIVRDKPMAKYFVMVMLTLLWLGISGYSGMTKAAGQTLSSIVFAGIMLNDRPAFRKFSEKEAEAEEALPGEQDA